MSSSPPEKNIFATPENSSFYCERRYQALNPGKHEIRLLRVHPDRLTAADLPSVFPKWLERDTDAAKLVQDDGVFSPEPFICCELLERISITTMANQYCALSYCAGSALQTKRIMIGGYWFNAFANLEHSLEGFRVNHDRNSWSGNLLWTDQVCINQVDYQEKSHQVGFMRKIYESAKKTYVVLSTPEAPIPEAGQGGRAIRAIVEFKNSWSQPSGILPPDVVSQIEDGTKISRCLLDLIYNTPEHPVASKITHLFKFLNSAFASRWWTRAWVLQEFSMSRSIDFICETESISYKDLGPLIDAYFSYLKYLDNHVRSRYDEVFAAPQVNRDTVKIIKALIDTVDELGEQSYQPINFSTMHFYCKDLYRNPYQANFLHHLMGAAKWGFQATDPRDMIYAFCGLSRITYGIIADYRPENTIWNVYITLTEHILEAHKLWGEEGHKYADWVVDLAVLARAGETKTAESLSAGNLPSWVPDWKSKGDGSLFVQNGIVAWRCDQQEQLHTHALLEDVSRSKWKVLCVDARRLAIVGRRPTGGYRIFDAGGYDSETDIYTMSGDRDDDVEEEGRKIFEVGEYDVKTGDMVETGDELWMIHGGVGIHALRKRDEGGYALVGVACLLREEAEPAVDGDPVPIRVDWERITPVGMEPTTIPFDLERIRDYHSEYDIIRWLLKRGGAAVTGLERIEIF